MRITTNDYGPYVTIFEAFDGYNVKISTRIGALHPFGRKERSCEILGVDGAAVRVRLFKDDAEDTASGEELVIQFDDIEEMEIY